jgi:hypothetical protein
MLYPQSVAVHKSWKHSIRLPWSKVWDSVEGLTLLVHKVIYEEGAITSKRVAIDYTLPPSTSFPLHTSHPVLLMC